MPQASCSYHLWRAGRHNGHGRSLEPKGVVAPLSHYTSYAIIPKKASCPLMPGLGYLSHHLCAVKPYRQIAAHMSAHPSVCSPHLSNYAKSYHLHPHLSKHPIVPLPFPPSTSSQHISSSCLFRAHYSITIFTPKICNLPTTLLRQTGH